MSIDTSNPEASLDVWELHTNNATSKEGSDVGLILKNHGGNEITYDLRFDFQVSNNGTEYEAILASLHLTQEVGVIHVLTFRDSLLITNQVNGTYEGKDQRMQRYLDAAWKL